MPVRDRNRRTEGLLSFGVLLVLLPALFLAFSAKWRVEMPADAIMLNEASAETFAVALGVDKDLATRLVTHRETHGGFESSDDLLDIPLFTRADAERYTDLLKTARLDPQTATAGQFAAVLGISPAFARRMVSYRDAVKASKTEIARVTQGATAAPPPYFLPPDWCRRIPLLDPVMRPALKRFLVRRVGTVFFRYWMGVLLVAGAVFLVPLWLRRPQLRVGGDPFLLPLTLLLTGLGVALLFSVKDPYHDKAAYENHLRGMVLGLIALTACARLSPAARLRIRNYQYVWVFAAAILVLALLAFGRGPEGVRLNLFLFQPVEVVKLLLVFFLASYLSDRAHLLADPTKRWTPAKLKEVKRNDGRPTFGLSMPRARDFGPIAVMYGIALLLFYVVKDLGPGVLLFATFISTLYLTTGRSGYVLIGTTLLALGAFVGYKIHLGVFATRVDMWLSPFNNPHPNGMQLAQAYWGMASGGMEGSGLGLGMPEAIARSGSDMAFASWAEQTGLPGAWLVLTVYVVLVWRGMRIALRAANDFDRALAFGLTALFGLQTFIILGGVTGVIPLTGLSLPFLSFGNSALVADFALIGLLRGISVPPSGGVGRPEPRPEVAKATVRFAVACTVSLLGVIGVWRLGALQLLKADEIAARPVVTPDADKVARAHLNPRLLLLENEIERGSIYDRTGRVLATSRPSEILDLVKDTNAACRLIDTHSRYYPFGPACAHLVGHLDPAVGGPSGFEKGYNLELRGFAHYTDLLSDYRSRHLPWYRPRRGRDLTLTLDAVLQRDAQAMLWETVSKLKDTHTDKPKDRAAFVLMEPQTGDVLVAATIPTYDPNTLTPEQMRQYQTGADAQAEHRLVNRAVSGLYPPGSTLKVATAACALDNLPDASRFAVECNRVYPEIRWQARGVTYVRRDTRDDMGDPNFGTLTLAPAFRVSSNIYFANLAAKLGAKTFRTALADKMHFRYTPPQEAFDADLPDIGYGQGRMLASPLEMTRLAAAVANEGKMMKARFVARISDSADKTKKQDTTPTVLSQAMTPRTASTLREMMRSVVTNGTAAGVFNELSVGVAGKTGTAQNKQFDKEPHSWFVGFAPYVESHLLNVPPHYAFGCVVENGGYGKRVAAVICRNILRKLF